MKRSWAIVWLVLGLLLVVRTGVRDRGVISDHVEFGRRLVAGEPLYAPYLDPKPLHPVYPPSFGLLTWPFSLVPEGAARVLWGIAQVLALWYLGARLRDWVRRHHPALVPRSDVLLLLTAVLASRYVLRDTHGGGGNLINLALAVGAFEHARAGRDIGAGVLLGASLATKPTTLLLVPLLWLLGRRRAALLGLVAAAALVMLALALHGRGLAPLLEWARGSLAYGAQGDVFATPAQGFPPFTWMNQCLRCAAARWLGTVPDEFAATVPWWFPGLGLDAGTVAWFVRAASLALLLATGLVASRARAIDAAHPALLAATLALSLLVSPISWKAHHVALIPAFFVLGVAWRSGSRGARLGWWLYLAACVVGGGDLVGDAFKDLEQSLYLATFGTLALWAFALHRAHVALAAPAPER